MDGERQKKEIFRLQSDILSKIQKKDGAIIKFIEPSRECANVVAVDVTDLFLDGVDSDDCSLACYGDSGVDEVYLKQGVIGIFEQSPTTKESVEGDLKNIFKNAQLLLNGVVFLFRPRNSSRINTNISYFFVCNRNLTSSESEIRIRSIFDKLFPKYS